MPLPYHTQMPLPIEKLYLDGNGSNIKDVSFLKELYIMNADKVPTVPQLLSNLSNLSTLSINGGVITEDVVRAIANLVTNTQLLKLELLGCTITNRALVLIINSIPQSSLRTLNFYNIFIANDAMTAMVNVLERSSLTKLSFSMCRFGHDLLILIDAIKKSNLQTLFLDFVYFRVNATTCIADCIAKSSLIKLSLCGAIFIETEPDMILCAIKQSHLKTLDVRCVSGLKNFRAINDLMLHCPFTKFKFDEYTLDVDEWHTLLDSMKKNSFLEHISFRGKAKFHDLLTTKVCDLLTNPRFKSFELDYRSLPNTELHTIMDAIKQSSITSLKFSTQYSENNSMMMIYDLMEKYHFKKLKFFDFENETIDKILPSIQQSSITKFSIESDCTSINKKMQNDKESTSLLLLYKIETILQARRQCERKRRNIKSAASNVLRPFQV